MRDEARIRRQCEQGAWFKRLLTDLVSVDFGVLLSRVFDSKLGGNISSHIIPPILDQKSAKIIPKIDETQIR
jgi:hypothetical protein